MSDASTESFVNSLRGAGVTATETSADGLADALADAVESPAVASPLPFDDLEYGEAAEQLTLSPDADALGAADTGVTGATFGVADYGSVAIQSRPGGDEPISLYPERHVAVVRASDVVDTGEAFERLADLLGRGESVVFATGASATADMGEFVQGVHGPGEVHVVLVGDR